MAGGVFFCSREPVDSIDAREPAHYGHFLNKNLCSLWVGNRSRRPVAALTCHSAAQHDRLVSNPFRTLPNL